MEDNQIILTESYLRETVDHQSSSLVGKIMKRFELSEDKEQIKVQVKELVYEQFRHLKDLLISYHKGQSIEWKFKSKGV